MIKIRKAGFLDIYNIYLCNKSCLPIYYSMDEFFFFMLSNEKVLYIAENGNELCAYILGEYNDNTLHILSFGVYPKYRRKRIGTRLINILAQNARAQNAKTNNHNVNKLSLYVHADNESGIVFYERNGFNKIKKLTNYYKGSLKNVKTQDAYRMEKNL